MQKEGGAVGSLQAAAGSSAWADSLPWRHALTLGLRSGSGASRLLPLPWHTRPPSLRTPCGDIQQHTNACPSCCTTVLPSDVVTQIYTSSAYMHQATLYTDTTLALAHRDMQWKMSLVPGIRCHDAQHSPFFPAGSAPAPLPLGHQSGLRPARLAAAPRATSCP